MTSQSHKPNIHAGGPMGRNALIRQRSDKRWIGSSTDSNVAATLLAGNTRALSQIPS